uniref:Tetratricopeptide repeat protein n=1 Tax=Desulfovibrio sp. U5L TaxID=596152 RepID=I2Q6U6_9BACT
MNTTYTVCFYGELTPGWSRSQALDRLAGTFGKSASALEGLFFSGKKTLLAKNKDEAAAEALIRRFARCGLVCRKAAAVADAGGREPIARRDAPAADGVPGEAPRPACSRAATATAAGASPAGESRADTGWGNFNGDLYLALERCRAAAPPLRCDLETADVAAFREAFAAFLATVDPAETLGLFRERVESLLGEYFFEGHVLPGLLACSQAYFQGQATVIQGIIRKYQSLCADTDGHASRPGAGEGAGPDPTATFPGGIVFSQDGYLQSLRGWLRDFIGEYQKALLQHGALYDRLVAAINAACGTSLPTAAAFHKASFGNLDRANRLFAAGHGEKALEAVEAGLAAYPGSGALRFVKAKILYCLKRHGACYPLLKSMTHLADMSLVDAYFFSMLASACCYELEKYEESLQYLQIVFNLDDAVLAGCLGVSGHQSALFCQAVVQARLGKYGLCRTLLRRLEEQGFDFAGNKVLPREVVADAFGANPALLAFYGGLAPGNAPGQAATG